MNSCHEEGVRDRNRTGIEAAPFFHHCRSREARD
eukprot:gene26821-biopygen17410